MDAQATLGTRHEIDLPGGRIEYHDRGSGAPVLFVHGLLVHGGLWRDVVPGVAAAGHRCLTPTLPLGSHRIPVPGADLTPTGIADLLADFLARLDLTDVTVVANDTGGVFAQLLLTRHPERLGRVVLAAVDSHDNFPPQPFATLGRLAQVPGAVRLVTELLRLRVLHRSPLAFGLVAKYPVPAEVADSYLLPSRRSAAVRADLRRFLRTARREYTLAAARDFPRVTVPVRVVWAREDRLFPLADAQRLVRELPGAELALIDDSYTFLPEDQPELLTGQILEFTRRYATP